MPRIEVRRGESPANDDVVVIHMGAGAVDVIVTGSIRNHDAYIGLLDAAGRFTISVFAATAGVSEVEILGAMPQGQFGLTSFGKLRERDVDVLATSVIDPGHPPELQRLQRVHFDLLVPVDGRSRPVADLEPIELDQLRQSLNAPVAGILALFAPRRRK